MTDDRSEATASGRLRPPGLGLFPQAKTQRAPSRNFGGGCDFPGTGEVTYKGEVLPGEQPAILDKSLFEAVQQKLTAHQSHQTLTRQKSDHLLKDILFDDVGHRMIATHATKAGVRYRYYVSQPGLHGEAEQPLSVRSPGSQLTRSNKRSSRLSKSTSRRTGTDSEPPVKFDQHALTSFVSRIAVKKNRLVVSQWPTDQATEPERLSISWQKPPSKPFRRILLPHGAVRESVRPDRAERRARLVSSIARGRRWLDEIVTGSVTDAEELARRERCTVRQVNLSLSLSHSLLPNSSKQP